MPYLLKRCIIKICKISAPETDKIGKKIAPPSVRKAGLTLKIILIY
jgi:hypothetical protein